MSTITDHILTDLFVNTNFKTIIFKSDISDLFPICFLLPTSRPKEENKDTYIAKRVINNNAIEMFKQDFYKNSSDDVLNNKSPNYACNYFLQEVIVLYDPYFPKQNTRINKKDFQNPWITRETQKSSKFKQRLCVKFLKNRKVKNELEHGNYKKGFESINKGAKKNNYFTSSILNHKYNILKTWEVIKETTGKTRCNKQKFYPAKVLLSKVIIFNSKVIAGNFNNIFAEIRPKLANEIEVTAKKFKKFDFLKPENSLIINKLNEAFLSLQKKTKVGQDEINFNVIKNCFRSLSKPLLHIFMLPLEEEISQTTYRQPNLFLFSRLVMKMNLVTTEQSLFYLVFLRNLLESRKFYIRRNNKRVDSIETRRIVIVHLLP